MVQTALRPKKEQGLLSGKAVKSASLAAGFSLIGEGISGFADFRGTMNRAENFDFAATQEDLQGRQEGLLALETLNDIQAANIVAGFASGVQASGSITQAQQAVGREAAFSISLSKTNAQIEAGALRREGKRLRAEARFKKKVAPFKIALGIGLSIFGLS